MKTKSLLYSGALILIGLYSKAQPVAAAPVTFTIDSRRSSISLSGYVEVSALGFDLEFPFTPQGTGSLTTSYTGGIIADLAPPNIQFPGGSTITAETSGIWKPAIGGGTISFPGSAPADYGVYVSGSNIFTGYFAGRNMQFDVTSSAAALTNGGFNSGLLMVTFLTGGSLDYNFTGVETANGTEALIGTTSDTPNTAYLTNAFNVSNVAEKLTLNIPVNITNVSTVSGDTVTIILTGMVVATAPAADWPLQVSASLQAGQMTLSWPSIPGQSFTVQTTQNLGASWTTAPGPLSVNANTTTWTGNATNKAQFFRVLASY
jgi:hypothetical protein